MSRGAGRSSTWCSPPAKPRRGGSVPPASSVLKAGRGVGGTAPSLGADPRAQGPWADRPSRPQRRCFTCSSPAPALLVRPAGWGRRLLLPPAPLPPVRGGCRRSAGVEHCCMSWALHNNCGWAQCPEAAGSDPLERGRPLPGRGGRPFSAALERAGWGGGAVSLSLSLSPSLSGPLSCAQWRLACGA